MPLLVEQEYIPVLLLGNSQLDLGAESLLRRHLAGSD
jgi:hypothetical protein